MLLVSPYTRALGPRSESSQAVLSRSLAAPPVQLPVRSLPAQSPPRPSHGVSHLSATFSSGSDLHRGYLPRLCCVLRFSQPLDASFRPHPFGPISYRCRPGFHLQSLSPHDSLACLSAPSAPLAVVRFGPKTVSPSSRDSCTREVRPNQVGVTRGLVAVPLLVFAPPRFPSLSLGPLTGASSHGLRHSASLAPRCSFVVVPALQSFKEPRS
jgi:hypothetical protein